MKTKTTQEKASEAILGRMNGILLLTGSILIIAGYLLMGGEGSTLAAYNSDIFSGMRIRVAPLLCLSGYLLNVFGILYRSQSETGRL